MTEREAINIFNGFKFLPREQKAVEMAVEALEKQIPKEPIIVHPLQENDGGAFVCPICKAGALVKKIDKFCWNCSQAIKWE